MSMGTRFVRPCPTARLAPVLLLAPAMSEHQFADSRTLSEPLAQRLATQAPALRSSNAILLKGTV